MECIDFINIMHSFPRLNSLAPRNPTGEDLHVFLEEKHRELRGYLCPYNETAIKDWTEIT